MSAEAVQAVVDARSVVTRLMAQGLQRVTTQTSDELRAAGQAAHAAGLIRIERSLEALAAMAQEYVTADPLFRTGAYRNAVARLLWLLTETEAAFRQGRANAELLGVARRTYVPVEGDLEVHVLAGEGWVTRSGFVGVTLHLHSPRGPLEIVSARPADVFGSEPGRLWRSDVSMGCPYTPRELAHDSYALRGAKVSHDGRLSMHGGLHLEPAPRPGMALYADRRIADWNEAARLLETTTIHPVDRVRSRLVLLEPATVSPLVEDDTAGAARLTLGDASGNELAIVVALAAHHNQLVDNLIRLGRRQAPRPDGLLGRVELRGGRLCLFPLTAVFFEPVRLTERRSQREVHEVHLAFESLGQVSR